MIIFGYADFRKLINGSCLSMRNQNVNYNWMERNCKVMVKKNVSAPSFKKIYLHFWDYDLVF